MKNRGFNLLAIRTFALGILPFFCTITFAQSPKSNVANIALQHGTFALSKEELSKFTHANLKQSSVPLDVENYYLLDGLVISFWDHSINPYSKRSLDDIRSGILGVLKYNHDQVNFSKIVTINKIRFLIYEYQKDDEVSLRFQSESNKNDKDIGGVIQFKKPDEAKAQKALQDLLQSMHFKE